MWQKIARRSLQHAAPLSLVCGAGILQRKWSIRCDDISDGHARPRKNIFQMRSCTSCEVEKRSTPADDSFTSSGARIFYDGDGEWKEWEELGVKALQKLLGDANVWTPSEVLRFLHLAISYRNNGISGSNYTEEDVATAKDLLFKSKEWKDTNRPTWTPQLRNSFKDIVFLQGRDKQKRPIAVVRPQKSNREVWARNLDKLNKAILALVDVDMSQAYLPGVAEQGVWIIDLKETSTSDIPHVVPAMQALFPMLTANWPGRGGTFFVINAGYGISAVINGCLYFAMEESRRKTQVFARGLGSHADKYFNLAELPVEFGGQATMGHLPEIKE